MNYIYLAIFTVFTAIHLYASLKQNKSLRNSTKGLILLAIMGFYCESVESISWLLIIALLTSWLGDLLLIPHGTKWFTAGGIFFMISHAFFIATYCAYIDFAKVPVIAIVALGVFFVGTVSIIFKNLKKHLPKALFTPMFFYLCLNGAMNCFALFRLISAPSLGSLITAIGAIGFFISDSSLFFVRFDKDSKLKTHFLVMLTYSLGEFLIVLGLIL